ncbi:trypsin-like peptidase domain-containing protein [Actinomadura fulvescens]|uniref:Trypsin-like peptidase domain-containing protein n=1 Tax=Actinomadura fulvescens TaxID=46160 RepID=A0ABN3PBI6_9ACTN
MDTRISRAGVAALAGLALLTGCSGGEGRKAAVAATSAPAAGGSAASQIEQQFEKVVGTVLPAVVEIDTDQGEGSGVVFDDKGAIVTNAHVVAGARKIEVTTASGGSPLRAELVGTFVADDLAVVRVSGGELPRPAAFGDSGGLKVGQMVLAMGNPLGLSSSVTNGIVSALGRTVSTKQEGAFPGSTVAGAIQTSAPINPGNSGGALVNLNGEVIGIPTAAASDPQMGGAAVGIGFAIPSNTVKSIAPQLIRSGKVGASGRAALGVTVRTVVDRDSGRQTAVGVVDVTKGGAADKAGIRPGSLILSVNGTATPNQTVLSEVLATLKPGDAAKVEIEQPDGTRKTTDVTLGQLPG